MMPPLACFQLEHCVRLSDLRLTGPGVHWTVHVCGRIRDCTVMHVCDCVLRIWVNAPTCDSACVFVCHTSIVCACVRASLPR